MRKHDYNFFLNTSFIFFSTNKKNIYFKNDHQIIIPKVLTGTGSAPLPFYWENERFTASRQC